MKKIKIIALISAIATALLVYFFLVELSKPAETVKSVVLTATADIPADTVITAEMIELTELPKEAVIFRAVNEMSQVIGKLSKQIIYTGQQIVSSQLISAGETRSETLAYAITPGMRAITVSVNVTSGVGYMIKPGDRIDLIGVSVFIETEEINTEPKMDSYVLLFFENITVLAVDNIMDKNAAGPSYATITLEMTPEQALKLSLISFEMELRAVLRSPLDDELTDLDSESLSDVVRARSGKVLRK